MNEIKNQPPKKPINNKFLIIICGIVLVLFSVQSYNSMDKKGADKTQKVETISFSEFLDNAKTSKIKSVEIKDNKINGVNENGTKFTTNAVFYDGLYTMLDKNNIKVTVNKESAKAFTISSIISILSTLLWIGLIIFIFRSMRGGGKMNFDKPRVKLGDAGGKKKTFDDVKGVEQAKEDVQEIVEFLKEPKKFTRIGGKIPKGVLLVGPPGTGKTLLARAIAGESGVPFFSISGSDFVEMFVGVGASRVRNLFEQGKKSAPCIIFIDEIDAVGRHRGVGYGGGNDEREQTLNQLLVEMDGFEGTEGVILIAATNRADVLDEALLRPGRFDRQIYVPLPDLKGREEILKVHLKTVKHVENLNVSDIARGSIGFSGAELANLVNEATLLAARENKVKVEAVDFEQARDKILMGAERKTMSMTPAELKLTAYHEAGHALVAVKSPSSDPIHKATIIPRGGALGMVQRLPDRDKISLPLVEIKADIAIAMAGRVAEEMYFGAENITTGASSDIQQATSYAKNAVTKWGMSEKLGRVFYEEGSLGYGQSGGRKNISDKTAELIDSEVKRFVDEGYDLAVKLMTEHKENFIAIAEALLKYETLSGDEITQLAEGKQLKKQKKSTETIKGLEIKSSLPIMNKSGKKATSEKKPAAKKVVAKPLKTKENSKVKPQPKKSDKPKNEKKK